MTLCEPEGDDRHQRGHTTSLQVRLEMMEQASAGLNDTQIATDLGCSLWTVRKWRRRALKRGRVGLTSRMGRPATGPVSTFPKELQQAILHVRKLHPGWGPATLLVARKMDAYWGDQPLPSRAHIARPLKQAGLTRRYQPHHDLAQPPRTQLTSPHQEWQLDAAWDYAGGRGGQGESDQHRRCGQSPASAESYPSRETTNPA
jgi:transposase-like protein